MQSTSRLAATAAAFVGLLQVACAQTNITASQCVAQSVYSDCNRNVANKWQSCINSCNGNGNCLVDCGCTAHQEYINCMAQSCWNQVYSCEYQLFVQQYFAVCPSASEPIPFWPAPDNAPNRCSCNLGKVLSNTLSARNDQVNCASKIANQAVNIPDITNINNLPNSVQDIVKTATECACCGASASLSSAWQICPDTRPTLAGADLWPLFFPSNYPNLYPSIPNFAWSASTCDNTLSQTNCKDLGFSDANNNFYKPGQFPSNGTKTLSNVAGTVTVPPSGTVLTWSQASSTYTVTATGLGQKGVAGASGGGTQTSSGGYVSQTENAAVGGLQGRGVGFVGGLAGLVAGGVVMMV
ncbi:Uncharacterized protein PECH_006744 [Penicillium ucsense]|uniref:Extracellular membrane protein CFEM domain-containing protein n=1 Tax=Penicillium ucsense TaxID=2839758 RepID=A0A8J8VY26_9EURO|nr:Uncharacterized protein PECM_000447 [Penicillium ucsense]KAF7735332.1 Uncharacterized protein PECH_006744 [Penicillium ucsense]